MAGTRICIAIAGLPPRARPLAAAELAGVFGGCAGKGQECGADSDCCNRDCSTIGTGGSADIIPKVCTS